MRITPTPRQQELLSFIVGYQFDKGCSPSFEEMAAGLGNIVLSGVHRLLAGLEERGAIRRLHGKVRAIEVVHLPKPVSRAPDGAPLFFVSVPE